MNNTGLRYDEANKSLNVIIEGVLVAQFHHNGDLVVKSDVCASDMIVNSARGILPEGMEKATHTPGAIQMAIAKALWETMPSDGPSPTAGDLAEAVYKALSAKGML